MNCWDMRHSEQLVKTDDHQINEIYGISKLSAKRGR